MGAVIVLVYGFGYSITMKYKRSVILLSDNIDVRRGDKFMPNISAKEKLVRTVLSKDYIYHISLYQRPYSWEEKCNSGRK